MKGEHSPAVIRSEARRSDFKISSKLVNDQLKLVKLPYYSIYEFYSYECRKRTNKKPSYG